MSENNNEINEQLAEFVLLYVYNQLKIKWKKKCEWKHSKTYNWNNRRTRRPVYPSYYVQDIFYFMQQSDRHYSYRMRPCGSYTLFIAYKIDCDNGFESKIGNGIHWIKRLRRDNGVFI